MKQTSLLNSFIRRQETTDAASSIKQSANKQQDEERLIPRTNHKRKNVVDSDEELQEKIGSCNDKLENLKFDDQRVGLEKPVRKVKDQPQLLGDDSNEKENFMAQFTDATPTWAQKQHCRDAKMRSSADPNYDPTTLHVPEDQWSKMTAPMKQFWKIKSDNFDKIVLFKLGKFYELFYDDAMIGNQYLSLKYMGTKMHTGFPEKSIDRYTQQLVEQGFKVVVVEQMETPDQMQHRVKEEKSHGRKSEKTIAREVTQVLTRGTVANHDETANYLPNYLLSIRLYEQTVAFSLLQISSNEILMGLAEDIDKFKTVLYQTTPVEIVYDPDNVPFELMKMMQASFLGMQLSKLENKNNIWHPLNSICEMDKLEKQNKITKPKLFETISSLSETNKNLMHATLSGMFDYLKKVFKFEYVITSARFTFYQKEGHARNMVLDSQALQHLEIFETAEGIKGSLFQAIDRTKTKFGRRLLRRWVMAPLMNTYHINQRLNAVEDLEDIIVDRQRVGGIFKKLPDMEKRVNKLYHYAIKTTNASKAVYFEDLNTARLKQFKELMQSMENAWEAVEILGKQSSKFKSCRLKQLVTPDANSIRQSQLYHEDEDDQSIFEGLLPDIPENLEQFKLFVRWENGVPVPQKGLAASFDQLQDELEAVKKELHQYLDSLRYQIQEPNLRFVHTKENYEIEVPEKSEKRRPKEFQFSSKRAGFSRYVTPTTRKYAKQVQKLEENSKEQMGMFIGFFFEEFKKRHQIWQRFVEILAELDCLISLSEYSFFNHKVRPKFSSEPIFKIRQARHPCLAHIEFIPNDISMKNKIMLLTGPNMGGKSTILRTTCTLSILAQLGSYVPAESYHCETIDRIFTRIGASDQLELGKSTFFIEMEETKSVLVNGTHKSLAIIDEFGRGTSTFDGMALAYSVLENLRDQIQCYCLFATHYHVLIDQFEDSHQVSLMKMDSLMRNGDLIFLYKLVQGHVEKSFGLSVAKMVGIPDNALEIADRKASQMNQEIQSKKMYLLEEVVQFLSK